MKAVGTDHLKRLGEEEELEKQEGSYSWVLKEEEVEEEAKEIGGSM